MTSLQRLLSITEHRYIELFLNSTQGTSGRSNYGSGGGFGGGMGGGFGGNDFDGGDFDGNGFGGKEFGILNSVNIVSNKFVLLSPHNIKRIVKAKCPG